MLSRYLNFKSFPYGYTSITFGKLKRRENRQKERTKVFFIIEIKLL